jgi:hypothetical protein
MMSTWPKFGVDAAETVAGPVGRFVTESGSEQGLVAALAGEMNRPR